ncbi:type IV secretion system protein TraC [Escherichia coli]|uniref:type IV secretion system protein TraC n=6 Tax=Enterobacteriaceae TaxID=543 RepID=UPI0009834C45|nr:type IV secretion system protein TraC [Escherichia coli]MDN2020994.1 type IV secretion system protein TraC [Escherichia coli]MDN2051170.1 type IV secretion system protein TraC [Escherichia coli]MDN2060738.1 type IV secretion system protein TraC [Escherichia coli]MDN2095931.1 type IV secretion system protein TraC [Escherichia coli]MDN2116094.1 type IV secretion system protein TraC [Escherichia coli]
MNNPLEAVTQAVNSLVTALKLPDESAKANEVLGEMSFPQFSRLLPYRDYNQESGLFMNDTTMGFMLEAIPINGANESIVEALDHMLRTKLPRGIPLCIHLMSSQLVGDRIEYGLREFSWSGEQAERFNAITRAYYMKAAATQFPLPEGMNLPLTLRHYRVFISYCSPSKKKSRADILEMENLVKIIRASLQGASITTQTVDAQAFIDIVGEMINHNPDSLYPKRRQLDPYSDLNYQCVEDSFDLKVRADYLTLGLRENGRNSTARILNFHLARNPEIAFLWNVADNYSNLLNPELSISCPFILTLTLVVEDQVKTHSEANLKYMDLEKKSKTSYAKWFPSVEKEAKEWGELRQRLGSGQSSVVSYFLNITAFCKDNNETALEVEQDILNSFRKNGFELISPRFNHMRNFLTCLPFMAGKGLFKQLKEAGVVQRAESFNVANLMPLVADNPLTPAGLLAPTYRNQLAFIDIFFRGMNNTNYNMAVCGTSGAGKTGLIQPLIRSVLDSGGFAVVFDMGDGYKSLCENMGGVYLDGETLRFNPFANITDIDQSAERVRDQLSVMASPNGNLDEVHEGLLLQAVRASWLAKENRARIDDVVDFLKNASDSEQYAESPTIRSRLDEMIVLLDQYTANGTYGQYFNSDEPSLRDDAKMVVLELGGLEDRPSLLVAVMFSLIIYIENRMYRTPRNLKKLNVIDEGWRLLDFKNHKVGEFIEKGYRTARRHTGAYITITQNIVDFDSDKASSAARAAWGNSSYKIILKQSAKEFAKYNQLYSHFASSAISPTASAAGSVVDGNYSYGNMQTENVNGFSWSTNSTTSFGQMMYQTGSGATATQTRDGNMVMDASGAMSRLPVGINTTRQIAAAQQEMAREASNRAESALHGFSSSIASAWNTLSQFGSNRGSSDSVTGGADSTMSAQDSMMASRMRSAVESYAKAHNISNEQATRELASRSTTASAGLYGDAHAGLDAKPSLFGVRVDVGAKVGGRASIDGSDLDSHEASSGSRASHDARHDIDARASKDFKEASDYFTSRKVSESGSHTDNNADSRVDQLSAALNSAKQSYDQYTTNMTRSHEYAEMASRTESMSGQMSEDLSQQFAQYVMKHAPQDAEAILTNTSSPEIAERRRAMAWSFVQEQVQPGVDNAWRESRGDIGKGMESVPSGGGSQDIIADHQGHQAIIEQRTQDSNIRNDVKHQVDNMVTEYRGNIGDTQSSIHGEENIVGRQYSELQNHHKTEALSQNNKYDEERESQKIIPEPSGEAVKEMIDGKKERLKGPL